MFHSHKLQLVWLHLIRRYAKYYLMKTTLQKLVTFIPQKSLQN
jgi:hypothetical protein